jgi:hypothetical protein
MSTTTAHERFISDPASFWPALNVCVLIDVSVALRGRFDVGHPKANGKIGTGDVDEIAASNRVELRVRTTIARKTEAVSTNALTRDRRGPLHGEDGPLT